MYLNIIFQVLGGLGLFLYGMDHMSKGMQKMAGEKLKKIFSLLTSNRLLAIFVGILITALVQSSSVSTVMTIGFVNATLLNLKQALGIILGANIGTTITGWILVLKIGKYGLPMAGLAVLSTMFMKDEKSKTKAYTIMGLGLIFFGLEIMSNGLKPLRSMPEFIELFHAFRASSYIGVLKAAAVGALLTAIVQSSSATLGITITLAVQGLIDYPTAVALVLGENVGTTITAILASLNGSTNAKRAAYAHTIINIVGVIWATTIFNYYINFLSNIVSPTVDMTAAIATAHTLFNITNVCLFIPFIGTVSNLLTKIVPDNDIHKKETVTQIDMLMVETPEIVVEQTKKEILIMGTYLKSLFNNVVEIINNNEKINEKLKNINNVETILDKYQKEIMDVNYLILNKSMSQENAIETRENIEMCDEYETVSDYLLRISKSLKKLDNEKILLNDYKKNILTSLHLQVEELFDDVNNAYSTKNKDLFISSIKKSNKIKEEYLKAREEHLEHVAENIMPAMLSTGYMDILNNYRRIKDHLYNLIETFSRLQ